MSHWGRWRRRWQLLFNELSLRDLASINVPSMMRLITMSPCKWYRSSAINCVTISDDVLLCPRAVGIVIVASICCTSLQNLWHFAVSSFNQQYFMILLVLLRMDPCNRIILWKGRKGLRSTIEEEIEEQSMGEWFVMQWDINWCTREGGQRKRSKCFYFL